MTVETQQQTVDRLSEGMPWAITLTVDDLPDNTSDRFPDLAAGFKAQVVRFNETGVMTVLWRMTYRGWVRHGTGPAIGSVNT